MLKVKSINKSISQKPSQGYYIATGYDKIDKPLERSRGSIVFQEDVMSLFASVCGITFGSADNIRRIVGKKYEMSNPKQAAIILGAKEQWLEGCKKNNIPDDVRDSWWNKIIANAGYSFNLSHATAYSMLTAVCFIFKSRYPLEYAASYLSVYPDKKARWISSLISKGFSLAPPNVSNSEAHEYNVNNGKLSLPLLVIDGLGLKASNSIYTNRPYGSLKNFMDKVDNRVVNRTIRLKLWLIGAFEGLTGDYDDLDTGYEIERKGKEISVYDKRARVADRDKVKFYYKNTMELESDVLGGNLLYDSRAKDVLDKYIKAGYEFGIITSIKKGESGSGKLRYEIYIGKSTKPNFYVSGRFWNDLANQLGKPLQEGMFVTYGRDKDNWGGRYLVTKWNNREIVHAIYDITHKFNY